MQTPIHPTSGRDWPALPKQVRNIRLRLWLDITEAKRNFAFNTKLTFTRYAAHGYSTAMIGRILLSVLLLPAHLLADGQDKSVHLKGSNTLIFLGQQLSLVYKTKAPAVRIVVQGSNISGQKPLFHGNSDLIQSEKVLLERDWVHYPVAVDGLVLYTHPSNPVKELTLQQIRDIYLGNIRNWKAVGGNDAPIDLYASESTTGTLEFFQSYVLKGREPYPFVGKSTFEGLVDEIARRPNAIGFSSYAATTELQALAIRLSSASLPIAPSEGNIRSRLYPLSRFIYWHVNRNASEATRNFCAWVLSSDGQLTVQGVGFEPLNENDRYEGLRTLGLN